MSANPQAVNFAYDVYLDATRSLSVEDRGLYFDFMLLSTQHEGLLDDENDAWIAHELHVSARKWRSFKARLKSTDLAELKFLFPVQASKSPRLLSELASQIYIRQQIPWPLRKAVYERDGFACVECGRETHLSVDHIVAVTSGGETSLDNLRTLCLTCNASKGAKNGAAQCL